MFFIRFGATPRRSATVDPTIVSAKVNCWIQRAASAEAIDAAKAGISEAGRIVDEPDEAYPVDESTYPPGKAGRDSFEQAVVDGEVFVSYCFPDEEWFSRHPVSC